MTHIIISDLHLGSKTCQHKKILNFLNTLSNDTIIIINGDLVENLKTRGLKEKDFKILEELKKFKKLVWVKGNHDKKCKGLATLLNTKIVGKYKFECGGKKTLCLHGHQYDKFINEHKVLVTIADIAYNLLQSISLKLASYLKHKSKNYIKCMDFVERGSSIYSDEFDYVCCGHTHAAIKKEQYLNSGCWTEEVCHYISITETEVTLNQFVA